MYISLQNGSHKYLPYDRVTTNDGIVFEIQSGNLQGEKSVIGRPKFFSKDFFNPNLGSVYWCNSEWFKIPISPQLYPLSNRLIKSRNQNYSIPTLEMISVLEYYSLPFENIKEHFRPVSNISDPQGKSCKANKDAREILRLLKSEGLDGVVGIGGSIMMGLSSDYSDIDLEVYGMENLTAVINSLFAHRKTTPRSVEELKKRYGQFNEQFKALISLEEYVSYESAKRNRGYFNGTKLTINVVDVASHPTIPMESFEAKVDLVGIVAYNYHARTHPAYFRINLFDRTGTQTDKEVEVISLSRVFIDQVRLNDTCLIRGYQNSKGNRLVVHHAYGGIKHVNIK